MPQSGKPAVNNTKLPLRLPDDTEISIFAKNLGGPRVMAFDPAGALLVSVPSRGAVYALLDANGDGVAENVAPVIDGLNRPHGIAFHDGKLYIAETDAVAVYEYDMRTKKAANRKKILNLPGGGNHVTRTIGFDRQGKLYVSIGSSCNVCKERDFRRAAILVSDALGNGVKVFASGLRNAVFFTWSPFDDTLWATNMGRDLLGDTIPPETVNIVSQGDNFGWPYCYGNRVHDRAFDASENARNFCTTVSQPHIEYDAHAAPLGLAFIPSVWPERFRNSLLVAFHGSWNRSEPSGYKIVRFILSSSGTYVRSEDFISGWLSPEGVIGRPVDVIFDSNGVLYITDDKAGVVYRVTIRR